MADTETIKSNVPEFSVSELAFSLKKTLEDNFSRVRVKGEIGRVTRASSGHVYTNIKDDNASIDAICWKGVVSGLSVQPEEGMEVICVGKISTYPQRSNYQLIIESMELAGEGALLKMLEERRKKLTAEGLFDPARKKKLPFLPEVIGVVTSPTGAVIRDILHRLDDRFPRHVLVWPVMVQGNGAAEQIASAINGFQTIHEQGMPRPDILIVARGGGSLEDLMPFNEEIVVRAAAASGIPLISAVGHETDTTLIDFAADERAPTPTAAAERAVPVRRELMALILDDEKRLISAMTRLLADGRNRLEAQARGLGDPAKLLEVKTQSLDHEADKISRVFREYISLKNTRMIETSARLRHPKDLINTKRDSLKRWSEQLSSLAPKLTKDFESKLKHAGKMLEAYSFENVLERGFAVVRDNTGALVTAAGQTSAGQNIQIQFKEKKFVDAIIGKNSKPKPAPQKNKDDKQDSLF